MKRAPEWLKAAIAENSARVLAGDLTQPEASARVKAEILARPEFLDERAGVLAASEVSDWVRANRTSGDLFQSELFPGIPAAMLTSPGRYTPVAAMTADSLDKARAMLLARTRNAKTAADRQQKDFTAFYKQVRPLIKDGGTVADAVARLAAKARAAA